MIWTRRWTGSEDAVDDQRPLSVGLVGNAADVFPELVRRGAIPDVVTDQTSAHDPLNGYIPSGLTLEEAAELRERDPDEYIRRARESMRTQVQAMLDMRERGAVAFDYGNNIRQQAQEAGLENAFDFPGFVPALSGPCFARAKGRSAGRRCREIRRTFIASTKRCWRRFPTMNGFTGGSRWPANGWRFKACPPASAGWATAIGPSWG